MKLETKRCFLVVVTAAVSWGRDSKNPKPHPAAIKRAPDEAREEYPWLLNHTHGCRLVSCQLARWNVLLVTSRVRLTSRPPFSRGMYGATSETPETRPQGRSQDMNHTSSDKRAGLLIVLEVEGRVFVKCLLRTMPPWTARSKQQEKPWKILIYHLVEVGVLGASVCADLRSRRLLNGCWYGEKPTGL